MPTDPIKLPRRTPSARRWARRLVMCLALATLAYLFRVPLLRAAGRVLVADDGPVPSTRAAILSGDRRYEVAARLVATGRVEGVLLVEGAPRRIQTIGVLPSNEAIARRELAKAGLDADRIDLVPGGARTTWEWARQLGGWLADHPDASVLVLTDRFASRHDRAVLRRVLPADQFARVRLAALPHREHDEATWWHDKDGGLAFVHGVLALTHVVVAGEPQPVPAVRTMEELEGLRRE